jgi:hypothetical protein
LRTPDATRRALCAKPHKFSYAKFIENDLMSGAHCRF